MTEENKATPEEIQRARDLYQTEEIEIDENADASRADDGVWVSAWVWLENEPAGDELCDLCMSSGVNVERTTFCGKTIGIECGCEEANPDGKCSDPNCPDCRKK